MVIILCNCQIFFEIDATEVEVYWCKLYFLSLFAFVLNKNGKISEEIFFCLNIETR